MAKRIIAIGDIHGRLDLLLKSLKLCGVIGSDNKWKAFNTVVIQMGDLIDRGPHSLKVIKLVNNLKKQAVKHNSRFELLYGNHEVMALFAGLGNNYAKMHWYYNGGYSVYKEWLKATGRDDYDNSWPCLPDFYQDFSPQGFYGKRLLQNNRCTLVVDRILFTHGGLQGNIPLEEIEEKVKLTFTQGSIDEYQTGIFSREGLFWLRNYDKYLLTKTCKNMGIKYQVVGHTPKNGLSVECEGKLVYVDVGINQNNLACAIEFKGDKIKVYTEKQAMILDEPLTDIFIPMVERPKSYPYKVPKYKEGDNIKLFSVNGSEFEVDFEILEIIKDFDFLWYAGNFIYKENGETKVETGTWPIGHVDRHGKKIQ
ncbi:metallophosphoesterase [Alkalicella caledoniensis]|uniref:Metallophosphoesterase n=1 Tax=Alkalicella caledoniensis TaxID=2731377 RepID=A0A7G9W519_ALKCA|nr:metallophosphoesterase [Alkalicella caledoniensis]QNO13781.1 metallophosphoesterase [Alkalicella caledoniensis]